MSDLRAVSNCNCKLLDALPFKAIPKEEAEAAMLKELKKVEIPTEESSSSSPSKPDDKVCPAADKEDASLKSPPHQTKSAKGKVSVYSFFLLSYRTEHVT